MTRSPNIEHIPRWLAPLAVIAAGGLALSACGFGETDTPKSPEQTYDIHGYATGDSDVSAVPPRVPKPSSSVLQGIIEKACEFSNHEAQKEFPDLWGDGLEKYSDQYNKALGSQESWIFDKDLAAACPSYARLTDHGAG